jgi:hypothetical protein
VRVERIQEYVQNLQDIAAGYLWLFETLLKVVSKCVAAYFVGHRREDVKKEFKVDLHSSDPCMKSF